MQKSMVDNGYSWMGEKVLEELNVNLPAKLCNQSPEKKNVKKLDIKIQKHCWKLLE